MKTLLVAASAIGLLASAPAYAESAQINVSATVGKACGVGNHISGASTGAYAQGDIDLPTIIDGNGQYNGGVEVNNHSFGNLWCNAPATVKLELSALKNATPVLDTGSFTNRLDLEIQTSMSTYVGGTGTISTVGEADGLVEQSGTTQGAFETGLGQYSGFNSLKVLPATRSAGGNYRPIAGDYSGFVRITTTVS